MDGLRNELVDPTGQTIPSCLRLICRRIQQQSNKTQMSELFRGSVGCFLGANRFIRRRNIGIHSEIDIRSPVSNDESHVDSRYCKHWNLNSRITGLFSLERSFSGSPGDERRLPSCLAND